MVCLFELPPMFPGFFAAAMNRAKQMPILLFKGELGNKR
jgi:hypothetical protein